MVSDTQTTGVEQYSIVGKINDVYMALAAKIFNERRTRDNSLILAFTFLSILRKCSFTFKVESSHTPRYLYPSAAFISFPFTYTCIGSLEDRCLAVPKRNDSVFPFFKLMMTDV